MHEPHSNLEALRVDREDLVGLLHMRFGDVPQTVYGEILQIDQPDTLQRLILVAANVPDWATFVEELHAGPDSFRLVGDHLNPLSKPSARRSR